MRSFLGFTFLLVVLSARTVSSAPIPALEIDGGLHPPGSAADLVDDRGVPQPGDGPIAYVIVTSRALRPAFLELGRERIRHGVRSAVRSLESLQAAYPTAVDDPDRIRQFLRDAHDIWGTQYVLLGGDSDVLPPRYVTTPSILGERHFVSDWYFACLDGTWDADHDGRYGEVPDFGAGDPGDAPDLVPELFVGRAPVYSPGEARAFVDKTIGYDERPVDGFENATLMFANVLLPGPVGLDFGPLADLLLPDIIDDPAQVVTRLYQSWDSPFVLPGALPETPPLVVDALDQGANVAIGFGAGSEILMEAGDHYAPDPYLTVASILGLTNGDRAGHVFLLTSSVNAFDTPTSLGEAFLKAQHGGAVTVIAPSDLTFVSPGLQLARAFVHAVYDEGVVSIGEALVRSRADLLPSFAITAETYQLLGDPMLRVFHASPVAAASDGDPHGRTGITACTPAGDPRADAPAVIQASGRPAPGPRAPDAPAALHFALAAPVPSPCVSGARIACAIPAGLSGVTLRASIIDLAGRAVRTLADRSAAPGVTTLEWNLRDDQGARVPAGVYFVLATAGGLSESRRLVVTGGR